MSRKVLVRDRLRAEVINCLIQRMQFWRWAGDHDGEFPGVPFIPVRAAFKYGPPQAYPHSGQRFGGTHHGHDQ